MAQLNVFRWGDRGAKHSLVALHGITANAGAMSELARPLAERGWLFLALDMRGHKESTRADRRLSFDSLLTDFEESVPCEPDVLLGHFFGGTLAELGILPGIFRPSALMLEDPVSHVTDQHTPTVMLNWDEISLPCDIDGLLALNPGWSKRDTAWKLLSLIQIDFNDARTDFAGDAPWDLRPAASRIAEMIPTVRVIPGSSRFVPAGDQPRLREDVGERAVVVMPGSGHSVHRDATLEFISIVEHVSGGTWF